MNTAIANPAVGLIQALHDFTDTILAAGPMVLGVGAVCIVALLFGYAVVKS